MYLFVHGEARAARSERQCALAFNLIALPDI
jgi:hypothetical protein